jgi:hypothetical protein
MPNTLKKGDSRKLSDNASPKYKETDEVLSSALSSNTCQTHYEDGNNKQRAS